MAHDHAHHTHQTTHGKAFAIGIGLNVIFVVVEVVYGYLSNSSALLADAGHNFSDVFSLIFAWSAASLATKRPTERFTYGLRKTTILVSVLNAVLLFIASGAILIHAIGKLKDGEAVEGDTIIWVAAVGIVINTVTALLFMKGQKEDLNIRGAFLHMAADAAVSLGVVVAGLLVKYTGLSWIDPITSFIIVIVIVWSTWRLFRDSLNLALDAVPKDIDLAEVKSFLETREGVVDVHDLHIWGMSTTKSALTAHLVMPDGYNDQFLMDLRQSLNEKFKIAHTTIQVEKSFKDEDCHPYCL
jgi:cobalt-zinc-cadmium efflux system protein